MGSLMGRMSQIALANMAHYYLTKGKISLCTECLREILDEFNNENLNRTLNAENINQNTPIKSPNTNSNN